MYTTVPIPGANGFYLRKPNQDENDSQFLRAMVMDVSVMQTQGGVLTLEQANIYLKFVFDHWEKHGFGHYILQEPDGQSTGVISLKMLTSAHDKAYDIGFMMMPAFRKQGLATAAAKALIGLALHSLKISRLSAMTLDGNKAGVAVLTKLGFQKTKTTSLQYMGKTFENVIFWELRLR